MHQTPPQNSGCGALCHRVVQQRGQAACASGLPSGNEILWEAIPCAASQSSWSYLDAAVTPRRLRPLARRRPITRRPPRVFMRARKPWVRFRLILCGWYVRFTTLSSNERRSISEGTHGVKLRVDLCSIRTRCKSPGRARDSPQNHSGNPTIRRSPCHAPLRGLCPANSDAMPLCRSRRPKRGSKSETRWINRIEFCRRAFGRPAPKKTDNGSEVRS